ncbi:MAG: hypothetical protein WAO57_13250 [Syntrophomonadaceae bacterium]
MSRFEELKFWVKDNPKIAFVVGMVLFAILIMFLAGPTKQARPWLNDQNNVAQIGNTEAKQEAKKEKSEEIIESKLGLKPMINGDLLVSEVQPVNTAISGIAYPTVVEIAANDAWWIKKSIWGNNDKQKFIAETPEKTGIVMIPVTEYSQLKFTVEQPYVPSTNKYHDTEVSILLDGTPIKSFILTPETMLTKPVNVNINTQDKGMLTVRIKTQYSIVDSYFYIKNPYPVWICDPVLTKEGEGDAQ